MDKEIKIENEINNKDVKKDVKVAEPKQKICKIGV